MLLVGFYWGHMAPVRWFMEGFTLKVVRRGGVKMHSFHPFATP